jgi:hypothetical protein
VLKSTANANYRLSTNTSNNNKTTQDKNKNRQQKEKTRKQRKVNQPRLFKLKRDLLEISINLRTALAADTRLAVGQWLKELGKITCVPSGNT